MAEYTPTTEQMLDMYAGRVCSDGKRRIVATRRKEFYGWLAQHVEQDERIQAWEAIAAHAAFADCYQEERPLLESVIDRIDALVSTEEAVVELSPSSLQAEIDRLNAAIERVGVPEVSTIPELQRASYELEKEKTMEMNRDYQEEFWGHMSNQANGFFMSLHEALETIFGPAPEKEPEPEVVNLVKDVSFSVVSDEDYENTDWDALDPNANTNAVPVKKPSIYISVEGPVSDYFVGEFMDMMINARSAGVECTLNVDRTQQ